MVIEDIFIKLAGTESGCQRGSPCQCSFICIVLHGFVLLWVREIVVSIYKLQEKNQGGGKESGIDKICLAHQCISSIFHNTPYCLGVDLPNLIWKIIMCKLFLEGEFERLKIVIQLWTYFTKNWETVCVRESEKGLESH